MSTLMQASRQWANRPSDQRFTSLVAMRDKLRETKAQSRRGVIGRRALEVRPTDDNLDLQVYGPAGVGYTPTHWGFGQLAAQANAPAGYMRSLPAPIAADCLNWGLRHTGENDEVSVLLQSNGTNTFRAVNGPRYGQVWCADVVDSLIQRFGDGVTGHFRVPGEFGKAVEVTNANTTLYASDRDMFVFLADEGNRIEVPNRRNGKPGSMARGFFVWNSEVGNTTLGIACFLFDYVCCNRIVWGAEQYQEIRVRHTVTAPDRWLSEVMPAIQAYAESSSAGILRAIAAAQAGKIDDVDAFLANRFGKRMVETLKLTHQAEEARPIETLWDATTAVTAYARALEYQDARVDMERVGGEILSLAA